MSAVSQLHQCNVFLSVSRSVLNSIEDNNWKKMTHWFHRNPLKATAPVSFNFYGVATTPAATKICK